MDSNIYHQMFENIRKALELILQSVTVKPLDMSLIECFVILGILESIIGRDILTNCAGLLL